MKLWLLRPADWDAEAASTRLPAWTPWYDKAYGFVVRAADEAAARTAAAGRAGDEGAEVWTDPASTSCVELMADGPAEVVMGDFMNG